LHFFEQVGIFTFFNQELCRKNSFLHTEQTNFVIANCSIGFLLAEFIFDIDIILQKQSFPQTLFRNACSFVYVG
jgi:hypothetical protein